MADSIATPRLRLLPLTPSLLRAVAGGDLTEVGRQLGAHVGTGWEEGVPAKLRLEQLAADASEQPWLVRAMVASRPGRVVGSIGFHAPPDERGRVEIGYDVIASERRKGYAREGIRALLDWAWVTRSRSDVRRLRQSAQRALAGPHPLARVSACRRADRRDRRIGAGLRAAPTTRALTGVAAPQRPTRQSTSCAALARRAAVADRARSSG